MKKKVAIALAAAMTVSALSACGQGGNTETTAAAETAQASETAETDQALDAAEAEDHQASLAESDVTGGEISGSMIAGRTTAVNTNLSTGVKTLDGAAYVLIYNPYIDNAYDSSTVINKLSTGDFSDQINIQISRAGGLDEEVTPTTLPTDYFSEGLDELTIQPGSRAGGLPEIYSVGETSQFYYADSIRGNSYEEGDFICLAEGENCYVWALDDAVTQAQAEGCAEQFDTNIYNQATEHFGQARFTDNGGKVNILLYDMDIESICGFFRPYDLFATDECTAAERTKYKLNTDRAIIHINAARFEDAGEDIVYSTLSHEFQHLINFTETLESGTFVSMGTWLNEAMSAYAEEMVYPGIKQVYNENLQMYLSENYKKGQSLYNFSTDNDQYFGAYGTVYLYEEYLRALAGDEVFSAIHQYWLTGSKEENQDAKALYHAVSSEIQQGVDASVTYPASITSKFDTAEDCWMSKLTLNFYLETLSTELANLEQYNADARSYMIYDEINPAQIEGGGRVVVATSNGSYQIPANADPDLIYVGLDADYNVITDIITVDDVGSAAPSQATSSSNQEDSASQNDSPGKSTDNGSTSSGVGK